MPLMSEQEFRQLYMHMTIEELKKYALVEMNIKKFQYLTVKYDLTTAHEILNHISDLLADFLNNRGYGTHVYGDTFKFLVLCNENPDLDDDNNVINEFLEDLVETMFSNGHSIVNKNIFMSFGILMPHSLTHDYDLCSIKTSFIRKECREYSRRSFSFEIYNEKKLDQYIEKLDLAKKLTEARHRDEFEVYIQPKIELKTGKIIGGEALLRWKDHSHIPVGKYLPILVEYGEIYLVDLQNLKKICEYIKTGLDNHQRRVPISVNITDIALFDRHFIKDYLNYVSQFEELKEYIEFEFLEDIRIKDYSINFRNVLKQIQDQGFKCYLDDFGSGNSSYAFILEGNITGIKLDRIFFCEPINQKRKILIESIIKTAQELNVKVIAEGVEDQSYIDFLKEINCDYVQGYYYYKPMPLEEFQKILDQGL